MTRDVEHLDLPDSEWADHAPGDTIAGGDTHAPGCTVRLNGPPGTGKTTEIAKRLAYLIEEEGQDPETITLVTYRRALADAVESRLTEWGVLTGEEDLEFWTTMQPRATERPVCSVKRRRNNRIISDSARRSPNRRKSRFVAVCLM